MNHKVWVKICHQFINKLGTDVRNLIVSVRLTKTRMPACRAVCASE